MRESPMNRASSKKLSSSPYSAPVTTAGSSVGTPGTCGFSGWAGVSVSVGISDSSGASGSVGFSGCSGWFGVLSACLACSMRRRSVLSCSSMNGTAMARRSSQPPTYFCSWAFSTRPVTVVAREVATSRMASTASPLFFGSNLFMAARPQKLKYIKGSLVATAIQ